MHPRETTYRLAEQRDYRRCHALARKENLRASKLSWPTVVAERGGRLIGFMSTWPVRQAPVAGPMIVEKTAQGGVTWFRLLDAYEFVLRKAGLEFYLVAIGEKNEKALSIFTRLFGIEPYARKNGFFLFKRELRWAT